MQKNKISGLLLAVLLFGFILPGASQTGYIYVHQKNINEESSVDFSFVLQNSSGATVSSFNLNDQATADNIASSGNNLYVYDIGVGHGTGGNGELWAIAGSSTVNVSNSGSISGTVYHRSPATSTWAALPITTATAIDGAYSGQFVYSTSSGVFFYNNGTVTQLYTAGTAVTDVTANNGRIAMMAGGTIYLYSNSYTSSSAPATGGSWTSLLATGNSSARLDMNIGATLIAYIIPGSNTMHTVDFSGTVTSLGNAGSGATTATTDIAYDDNNNIYATVYDNSNGGTNVVASYNGSAWTTEINARTIMRLTGGAGKQVYGVENLSRSGFAQSIWYRATDNTGTAYWIDDERVKSSSSLNGNGIIIPVTAGTYTLQETLPSSSWDLGRFNLYDPGNASTGNVSVNSATITVTAGEVVYAEFVNEKLNPKAITLACIAQYLETFDASNSSPVYTYTYGSSTYGTTVEGSAYHNYLGVNPEDGYYYLVKNTSNWFNNTGLTDHTGNSGYFLIVNASYAKDEFYRQRVTNLVPGLQYTISFYAANVSPNSPIVPNILYGLQDQSGNVVNSAISGNFAKDAAWHYYSFTFIATTSTADLFLRNQTIGGNGNDIAIDDISLNPVITPLAAITVSPVIAPNICIGTNYTFSNSQSGGIWTSSNTSVATINAQTGKAKGLIAGSAEITYTYTNSIGCTSTQNTAIIVSTPPAVTASDLLGGSSCLAQTDSLYSSVSGGSTPYTYSWVALPSAGAGLSTANIQNTAAVPTSAGSYVYLITVTDAVGCSATGNVTINVSANTAPTVAVSGSNVCLGAAISNLKATASGGSGTYTYTWTANPSATSGIGSGNYTLQSPSPTPTAAGAIIYKVAVNDGNCSVPASTSVTVYAGPSITAGSSPGGSITLCSNGVIALTSAPTGGTAAYTYAWSTTGGAAAGLSNTTNTQNTTATPTTTNTSPGYTYNVLVTDANGCTATASTTIKVTINNSFNSPAVNTPGVSNNYPYCSGGTITLSNYYSGGTTGPYSYAWSGPGIIASPTGTSSSSGSFGSTTAVYTTTTVTKANYVFTVTDANGCSNSASAYATVNPNPVPVISAFAGTLCNGQTTDSIYTSVSGASGAYDNFNINNGIYSNYNTAPSSPLATSVFTSNGTYTVVYTVQDASSQCPGSAQVTINKTSSVPPTLSGLSSGSTCTASASYSSALTGTISGGTAPYNYSWAGTGASGTGTGTTATGTAAPGAAGTYNYVLTVTDANSCIVTQSTSYTFKAAPTVSAQALTAAYCGTSSTDQLYAIVSGGSGTYSSYAWTSSVKSSPGSTSLSSTSIYNPVASISGASTSSSFQYNVTVTDANSCTGTASTTIIPVIAAPVVSSVTATPASQCALSGNTISLSASVSGGTPSYNYSWTAPSNSTVTPTTGTASASGTLTASATATVSQNYSFTLTVLDANNCEADGSTATVVSINSLPGVTASVSNTGPVCANPATSVTLTSTPSGGSGTYTYLWSGSGTITSNTAQNTTTVPAASGGYTVTVTDGNNCTATATTPAVSVDQAIPFISITCGTNSSGINYAQLYESNGNTWLWTTVNGGRYYATSAISPLSDGTTSTLQAPYVASNGTYTAQITDASGCTGSGSVTITPSTCSVILAVTDLNFTAQKQGNIALLKWGTASETNNSYFNVERSTDGINWQVIGTVTAKGNSTTLTSYSFADALPVGGTNYYRLKQVDVNGIFKYSQVKALLFSDNWLVKTYPNPVQNLMLLEFNSNKDEDAAIIIYAASGQVVYKTQRRLSKGLNRVKLNTLQALAQGAYIVTISTTENIFRSKFVKSSN